METLSQLKYQPEWGAREVPEIPECGIFDVAIGQQVKKHPDKTAIINLDREFTFGELDDLSSRFANVLLKLGIGKGDRVATLMPNLMQHFIAFYGITKIGAISVPCNVMYRGEELAYQLTDSGAKAIVALDLFYPVISAIQKKTSLEHIFLTNIRDYADPKAKLPLMLAAEKGPLPEGTIDFSKAVNDSSPKFTPASIDAKEDLAMILYTSGTTGLPKGVMLSHYNFCSTGFLLPNIMDMKSEDIHILIFPMFHVAGYCFHIQALATGATVIPIPMFDAKEMLSLIEKKKVTVLCAPPTVFIALISNPDFESFDLSSLTLVVGCGGPTPSELQKRWKDKVGHPLDNGLGCSETTGTSPGLMPLPNRRPAKLGSLGVTSGEVKIVDKDGAIVPRGTLGEIFHRGPGIAKGYWNKPEETNAQFTNDGWWASGDAGFMDENGDISFEYRIKDLIVSSGYNVSPVEIENIMYKHEAIQEICIYSIKDSYRGESAKALITLNEGFQDKITESDIIAWCKQNMAAYKVPKVVEFGNIPKTASGKMLRYVLQQKDKDKYS